MKGDPEILTALNELLTAELTAINQYYVHAKMCANWGYRRLAAKKMAESKEEMGHADKLIERILFLEGVPNMQRLFAVKVGEDPVEQHRVDLQLERDAAERLQRMIPLFRQKGDVGSALQAEAMLQDEEEAIDWHEQQLALVATLGKEHYLAQQMHD